MPRASASGAAALPASRTDGPHSPFEGRGRFGAAVLVLAACMLFISWIDPYRDEVREGNRRFDGGDYSGAEDRYRAAERYAPRERDRNRLRFNHGDARYMQGDYDGALDHFRGALRSGDRETQKKALFNAGNAYMKKGDFRAAAGAYMDALKIDPEYAPAKKNLEYMLRMSRKEQNRRNTPEAVRATKKPAVDRGVRGTMGEAESGNRTTASRKRPAAG